MDEHPNAATFRRLLEAFDAQDLATITASLSDDIKWHEAGSDTVTEGKEALAARFASVQEMDGEVEIHDVVANGEHVVAMINATLRKPDGTSVSYPAVEIGHVRDGLVTERWAFMDAVPPEVQEFFADLG